MEVEKFVKSARDSQQQLVVAVFSVLFKFQRQCGQDVGDIFDRYLETDVLLLIGVNELDGFGEKGDVEVLIVSDREVKIFDFVFEGSYEQ